MGKLEYKSCDFEIKASDDGRLYIKGYASPFGNIDSYNDIVAPGSYAKTLSEDAGRIKFCKDHDLKCVIGKPVELKEDSKGLYFEARFGRTTQAKEAAMQVEDGELSEVSIGYIPVKYENITLSNGRQGRRLTEIKLIEVSLVSRAANPEAVVTGIYRKSEEIIPELSSMPEDELAQLKSAIENEYATRIINHLNRI